ncbi:MAG: hypothetical protein ACSHX0_06870 [Akkermansiaceae bacterium]
MNDEKNDAANALGAVTCYAWQCNLGDEGWDHDWEEKHDSTGELDGHSGQEWQWRECRVCGITEEEFLEHNPKEHEG